MTFKPISVSKFIHKDGFFNVKGRPFASLGLRISGIGDFEIEGEHFATRAGDALFIPSGKSYKVEYSSSEIIVVHLDVCNYRVPEHIPLKNAAAVHSCFEKLLGAWNETHSINKAKAIIYEILEKISEDKKILICDASFAECVSYIHEHCFESSLDIASVAARAFISASTLQRKFHEHFEMTPKQYLTRLRMSKALELLAVDELSVGQVALACGFSDEKYFSRTFKRMYGHPPSEMKKHIQI